MSAENATLSEIHAKALDAFDEFFGRSQPHYAMEQWYGYGDAVRSAINELAHAISGLCGEQKPGDEDHCDLPVGHGGPHAAHSQVIVVWGRGTSRHVHPRHEYEPTWTHKSGTVEHVIEVARVLGFCNEQFTRSYGDFMDSPITAKNELTVSAWSKAQDIGAEFLEALTALDAADAVSEPTPRDEDALTKILAEFAGNNPADFSGRVEMLRWTQERILEWAAAGEPLTPPRDARSLSETEHERVAAAVYEGFGSEWNMLPEPTKQMAWRSVVVALEASESRAAALEGALRALVARCPDCGGSGVVHREGWFSNEIPEGHECETCSECDRCGPARALLAESTQ